MNKELYRVLMVTLLMIFSSLAGCLEGSDDDEKTDSETVNDNNDDSQGNNTDIGGNNTDMGGNNSTVVVNYGTVMVSTYHVGELVSAIVGDSVTIEYMADPGTAVHDYTPSDEDKLRLKNADIFFYHGLNLEPWVEGTLANLGSAAPPAYETHTMPSGELALDYESLLKMGLCEELTTGEETSSTLVGHEENASDLEIHAEKGVQKLMFPEHDEEDHDDDMEDEESILMGLFNESDVNGDNLLDLNELEGFIIALDAFEEEHEDDHDGHGHDDGDEHGHGDGDEHGHEDGDEHAHGDGDEHGHEDGDEHGHEDGDEHGHGDGDEHGHGDGDEHGHGDGDEHGHGDGGEHGHGDDDEHGHGDGHDHEDGHSDESMTPEQIIAQFDTDNDSMISWDEFWYAWNLEDDHDDHDHIEPEKVFTNLAGCPADTVINVFHLEKGEYVVEFETEDEDVNEFHLAALPMLGGHAHHDHGEGHADGDNHTDDEHQGGEHGVCHDLSDHSNHDEYTNKEDCEAAGHMWMEEEENHQGDTCHDETTHQNTEHDNQADCEAAGHIWFESDEDGHGHGDHDDHDEHHGKLGFLTIHIEAEGDYGFALPSNIGMFILSNGESHEGHDHGSHGDSHGGHDDSHSDGSPGGDDGETDQATSESEIDAGEAEDDFEYDPHSWLDPLSFKAQVNTVLAALIETFPEGEETFTTNADIFKTSLDRLHLDIIDGIGEDAGCATDTVAANHNAYSYLSVRYGVDFVTVHGLDPEGEPAAADILEVIEKINEDEILVLFIEEYTSESAVDSITDATNVDVLYLYTMELPPKDDTDDYLSLMYKNLENLKTGLGCNA